MRATARQKNNGLLKRAGDFLEKTFLAQKLNNWLGYLMVIFLALGMGYLVVQHTIVGLGVFGGLFALLIAVFCMSNAETGLYITLIYSFFAFFISRLLFKGMMSVGVMFDSLVIVSFLGLVIKGVDFRKSFSEFARTPLVIGLLVLLFYVAIELFNPHSRSFQGWFMTFRNFLSGVLFLFTAYTVFDSYEKMRRFVMVLFVISTISALYGCIQQWHGYFNFEMELILADEHGFGLIFIDGEFRKYSTMSDPAAFGILMAACSVFYLILASGEPDKFYRWLFIIGAFFMVLGMGYSGTRTAYAIIVAGLAFFILLNFEKKSTRTFALVAGAVFAVLMYGPYTNKTINRFRTTFAGSDDPSFNVRVKSREFIQPYILSHPIGGGLGTTGATGVALHPGHYLANFQPDSSYLKKATETGWVGLAIICVLYFIVLRTGIRGFFATRSTHIKLLYAAALTSIFSFYVAEYAQVAIGQITDVVVYYPLLAMMLKLKYYDKDPDPEHLA